MEYNPSQETSETLVISYPYEGGIDERIIPYEANGLSNQVEDSKLEKTVFD